MGVTTSGIRWPEPTEPTAQGAAAMRSLAEDVTTKYGRGLLARTVQAVGVDVTSAGATILATTVTLPAQRWLRIAANVQGQQLTTATATRNVSIYLNNAVQTRIGVGGMAVNETVIDNGEAYVLASAGTVTVDVRVSGITASIYRIALAGATFLAVQDVGGPTSFTAAAADTPNQDLVGGV